MGLPKNISIATAMGTAALVAGIHAQFTPAQTDIRTSTPGTIGHADVGKSRRQATWFAAAAVGAIYLMTKDETTLIIGGSAVVGFDVLTRYNNEVFPPTQRIENPAAQAEMVQAASAQDESVVQMSSYANVM